MNLQQQINDLRRAGVIICVFFIVAFAVGGAVSGRINADARHRDKRAQCELGNQFRENDKARWDKLLSISPAPTSEAGKKLREVFFQYIDKADALRDCSNL